MPAKAELYQDHPLILTNDGSYTFYHPGYKDLYRSKGGAKTEAQVIFLEGSGITRRFRKDPLIVLEIGSGTLWNLALTLDAWVTLGGMDTSHSGSGLGLSKAKQSGLMYLSCDLNPLPPSLLKRLNHKDYMKNPCLWERFLDEGYGLALEGTALELAPGFIFKILRGDAREAPLPPQADCIYFDPFRPETNPELWESSFLKKLVEALLPGGVLVTYSARGSLRRELEQYGLRCELLPAPSPKRQFLRAHKPPGTRSP